MSHVDDLVQDRSISISNALAILQSYTKQLMYFDTNEAFLVCQLSLLHHHT